MQQVQSSALEALGTLLRMASILAMLAAPPAAVHQMHAAPAL